MIMCISTLVVAPSWRSRIFICSSIGQDGVLGSTDVVHGGGEVRFHHGTDVVLVVLLHHVVHAWRAVVGVELLDVGHVDDAWGAIVCVELHMALLGNMLLPAK
jgi:hypothetical protein